VQPNWWEPVSVDGRGPDAHTLGHDPVRAQRPGREWRCGSLDSRGFARNRRGSRLACERSLRARVRAADEHIIANLDGRGATRRRGIEISAVFPAVALGAPERR
jgi:hypothetical protein